MRERSESGQTVKQWCKKNGILEKTYYYWQRKLREAACEAIGSHRTTGQNQLTLPVFKEVQLIKNRDTQLSESQEESGSTEFRPLTIEMNGLRITASQGYPPDQLTYIVQELMRTC
jgi:transposase-like protein